MSQSTHHPARSSGFPLSHRRCRCVISLGLALLVSSCSDSKISQCNDLISMVNQTESDLSTITQATTPDIDALKQIAETTRWAVTQLNTVELRNSELKTFQEEFRNFYNDISIDAQMIVTAHEKQNMPQADQAYQRLENTFSKQEQLVNGINRFCSQES